MAAQARSKKPEDSDFKQQRLRAWEPLLTPFWVILTFLSVGLLFLIIGIVTLHASNQTVEVEQEYKGTNPICPFDPDAPQPPDCCDISLPNDPNCLVEVELVIPKTMTPPIFVYYKLTSFYQNHRRYVKSRSDPQLSGTRRPDVSPCDPLESIGDKTLYPCGLIAHSRYNDTVLPPRVERDGSEVELDWEDKGIAWKSDMKHKFEARPLEDHETNIGPNGPVTIDEELAVWMRTAGLPTFKKLHRIIRRESLLEGETVTVPVHDVFQVDGFGGTKAIVFSTTSWLGGKNEVLPFAYLVVGGICFFLGIVFLGLHIFRRRDLGDMKYWNWRS